MEEYPALELDAETTRALDILVTGYGAAVVGVLFDAELDEPIASVCLSPGQEEGMDTLPMIFAGRAADRERLIREGLDDWSDAWNPFAFRDEEDVVHPTWDSEGRGHCVELPKEVVDAWEIVRDSVEGRCLDPGYWVHGRVAHQLNRQPLPIPATPDLAVWVFDFDAGQGGLLEMLTAVLRPDTFAALEASGLIGEDEEAAYRG